jgi:hypothetical protein
MEMNFLQRTMAINKPYATLEVVQEQLDCRSRLLAVWTLEITILGDRDASVRRAAGTAGGQKPTSRTAPWTS